MWTGRGRIPSSGKIQEATGAVASRSIARWAWEDGMMTRNARRQRRSWELRKFRRGVTPWSRVVFDRWVSLRRWRLAGASTLPGRTVVGP